jgi:hypothetical protein
MKNKSQLLIAEVENASDIEAIQAAFEKKLAAMGLDQALSVASVEFGDDDDILVQFEDREGEIYSVSFMYDEKEGAQAFPIADDSDKDIDDEETESSEVAFDLGAFNPVVMQRDGKEFVDLKDLSWLDEEVFMMILQAAGLPAMEVKIPGGGKYDAFGNFYKNESINEIFLTRIIGGKRVRVQAVRRLRKRRLTPKQRAGIRKAVAKRKRYKAQIARKRKRSLAVRQRMHIKSVHLPKGFRVRR